MMLTSSVNISLFKNSEVNKLIKTMSLNKG